MQLSTAIRSLAVAGVTCRWWRPTPSKHLIRHLDERIPRPRNSVSEARFGIGSWLRCLLAIVAILTPPPCTRSDAAWAGGEQQPAPQWPFARGNAAGTGVANSNLPAQLELLWKRELGSALEATAIIAENTIFIGDVDGGLHAVKLEDGTPRWNQKFASGFLAAGVYADGKFIVGDYDGVMRCLATADGKLLWKFEAPAELNSAPIVRNGKLLTTCEDGTMYCLDIESGKQIWAFETGAPLRGSPTVADARAVLVGCDALLHVVNVDTGVQEAEAAAEDQTGATPAFFGGHVYFGTGGGVLRCFQLAPPEQKWAFRDPRRGQPIRGSAAVDENWVIYGSEGKQVYGINRGTGALGWQLTLRSGLDASPVIVGDRVLLATSRGRLLTVNKADGRKQWQYDAGGGFIASPAVADKRLVIGNEDGTLYCFGGSPTQ